MWATFEHSWRLLSEDERQVFARLSVFRGGFEEEAAIQVARGSPQILAALVDKSLLRWDGTMRYDLHELVRQYASDKLEQAGETQQLRRQHAEYYLALMTANTPRKRYNPFARWLDRDYDNVRSALEWSLTTAGDPEVALRLAGALSSLWRYDIRRETITTLQRVLDHPLGVGRTFAHARARVELALHLSRTGNYRAAQDQNEQALSLVRELGDSWLYPLILGLLGGLACTQGDSATARTWLSEGIAVYRQNKDTAGLAWALIMLAEVAILDEDPAWAEVAPGGEPCGMAIRRKPGIEFCFLMGRLQAEHAWGRGAAARRLSACG